MSPGVYIFIGLSGSGKGTQVALLKDKLKALDPKHGILNLETGSRFRELIKKESFTAVTTREVMAQGKLPPPFLGIHAWSHFLIEDYDGKSHVFMDGTPRVPDEVPILLSAAAFYGWEPHVFFINVSDEWAHEKLSARGRSDDLNDRDVWGRIEWFHKSVVPTIELLKLSPLVTFHSIWGEQTIEAVHNDICDALGMN